MENAHSFRKFKKEPLILSLLLLAAAISAFLFVYGKIEANKRSALEAQAQAETEQARRDESQSLERLITSLAREREIIASHFAKSSDVVPFLNTLEALARSVSANSEITSVNTSGENSMLAVEIKATGTFESLYKYLLLLENAPYQLEFLAVDLRKGSEESGEWAGNFKVKLLSFIP